MSFKAKIFKKFEFSHQFFRFLLIDRVRLNKDNLILVTGKRGDGKTTMGLKILLGFHKGKRFNEKVAKFEEYFNEELNRGENKYPHYKMDSLTPFDMKEHMAFTRGAIQDLCRNLVHGFILGDEAITNTARKNSMTKANKILHEVLTINRKNKNTIFFLLPAIEDFDLSMLQYCTMWIHIDDRGLAAVLFPEPKSLFGRKSWDIDKMKKIYDKFLERNPTITTVPYWLFDNFRGYIRFRQLSKKTEDKYLEIAMKKKNQDTESQDNGKGEGRSKISDREMEILEEIADKLISGEIVDSADYYAYCAKLEYNKSKLNRTVNDILISKGDGRTASRIIKENSESKLAVEEQEMKTKRVIY